MWTTLILPLATTFKAPACLDIVARLIGHDGFAAPVGSSPSLCRHAASSPVTMQFTDDVPCIVGP